MPDFIEIAENSCGASSDQFWTEMRRFEILPPQPASTVSTRQKVKSARNRADPYIRLLLGTQPKKYDTLAG